ncbi:unknown [Crocosphaera subtropica ATCC 51142]|uniref:Uncharacterized protein n=1 Tax=Crocosphaera subtropica (strain ATCC 51142 / BH68) TaxID=43989 RepID=B1WT17_CROS5|nr:hypothetical protein [Crocosphaera subtropica]ACB50347.1 unknown [Crocosphaera subtropica ATCC 51142]
MAKVTENDLKRLEGLIMSRFDQLEEGQRILENRLNSFETRQTTIKEDIEPVIVGQNKLKEDIKNLKAVDTEFQREVKEQISKITIEKTELQGDKKTINAKLDGVSDRLKIIETAIAKIPDLAEKVGELKYWRQIVYITLTAMISGFVGWLIGAGNFIF